MGLEDVSTYLILSYFCHTAARITGQLIPLRDPDHVRLLQEWLSSAFGIMMGFSAGVNVIADAGITMAWSPAGYFITGILLGQGVKFGLSMMDKIGNPRK